jgi:hypothetical protein
MVNPFLTNDSLRTFVKGLKISQERKEFLLSKIPQLDEEERKNLFDLLLEIYLLDLEEKRAIERIKKYWK